MSKIGKKPIIIPENVTVEVTKGRITAVSGEKKLEMTYPAEIGVEKKDQEIYVTMLQDSKTAREQHGLIARLLGNLVKGVSEGFSKELTFLGTGYRVAVQGSDVVLTMGYSHDVTLAIPEGLEVKVVKNTITVSGASKERVGQFAAIIREVRKPEVYKGKGIKYKDEHIRRKAGKTAASK